MAVRTDGSVAALSMPTRRSRGPSPDGDQRGLCGHRRPRPAFVELQMYSAGQNVVAGRRRRVLRRGWHERRIRRVRGRCSERAEPAHDPGRRHGGIRRRPPLRRTSTATSIRAEERSASRATVFGVVDCVSWGAFSGPPTLPAGEPAPALSSGQSLTRSIARGCATLLEAGDDTDDSAADFALARTHPASELGRPDRDRLRRAAVAAALPTPTRRETKIKKAPKGKIDDRHGQGQVQVRRAELELRVQARPQAVTSPATRRRSSRTSTTASTSSRSAPPTPPATPTSPRRRLKFKVVD